MSDLFNLDGCGSAMVRPDPPTVLEDSAAELWVLHWYRQHFQAKHPLPQHVTWQLARLYEISEAERLDEVIGLTMKTMDRDFRNPLLPSAVKRFRQMLKGGERGETLTTFLKEISPGGSLKPDMLGISCSASPARSRCCSSCASSPSRGRWASPVRCRPSLGARRRRQRLRAGLRSSSSILRFFAPSSRVSQSWPRPPGRLPSLRAHCSRRGSRHPYCCRS
jgi:hypothetical protein